MPGTKFEYLKIRIKTKIDFVERYFSYSEALSFLCKENAYARGLQGMWKALDDLSADLETGKVTTGFGIKQQLDSIHGQLHGVNCRCAMMSKK